MTDSLDLEALVKELSNAAKAALDHGFEHRLFRRALSTIEELRKERDEASQALVEMNREANGYLDRAFAAEAQLHAAQARIEGLEGGLRPFVDAWVSPLHPNPTPNDYRRAHLLLQADDQGSKL